MRACDSARGISGGASHSELETLFSRFRFDKFIEEVTESKIIGGLSTAFMDDIMNSFNFQKLNNCSSITSEEKLIRATVPINE